MTDTWVALEAGADPVQRRGALHRAYESFATAGRVERPVRSVVAASWQRSARAHVSPGVRVLVQNIPAAAAARPGAASILGASFTTGLEPIPAISPMPALNGR